MQNALLATGRFLTIQPGTMLHFSAKRLGLKILPVDLPFKRWPVGIVTLKNRTLSPVVQLFIDCARKVASPLAKARLKRSDYTALLGEVRTNGRYWPSAAVRGNGQAGLHVLGPFAQAEQATCPGGA